MNLAWDVPLGASPDVVSLARNAHGFVPVDRFCLPDLWSLHLYGYEASLKMDDVQLAIRPGCIGLTPPGCTTEYRYLGISVHIYAHFRLDPNAGAIRRIPAMHDLGEGYESMYRRLYSVVGYEGTASQRVNARVWDVLWDLVILSGDSAETDPQHPSVARATDIIAKNLGSPLSVEAIAGEVGISYNYLSKLFKQAYGDTVIGYIRKRRLDRAVHLLERSTLPIKTIAASVGIPDIQHFNKAVRHEYGLSPRGVRDRYRFKA